MCVRNIWQVKQDVGKSRMAFMKVLKSGQRLWTRAILFLLVATLLSACGVRGNLALPEGQKAQKTDRKPVSDPAHRPFILDRLLK